MEIKVGVWFLWSVLISLIILLSFSGFIFYDLYLQDEEYFQGLNNNFEIENKSLIDTSLSENFPEGILFYPNMRFPEKLITYSIDRKCGDVRADETRDAFNFLENNTVLSFMERSNGMIRVSCSDEKLEVDENHFIAGEGGPTYIIDSQNYKIILNGTILLYEDSKCDEPVVAIHELLHVLGFKHSSDKDSIMYSVSNCKQKVSQNILNKINELYKDETLPDLTFQNVQAIKHGRYLDFSAEIMNFGLTKSENSTISIISQNKTIDKIEIGELEFGSGKIINVTNLKISYSTNEIEFILDSENIISEINEANNIRVFVLK